MIAYLKNEVDFFYLFDKRSYFLRILKLQRINLFTDVNENYKRIVKKNITLLLKKQVYRKRNSAENVFAER
jgi:hypothetical protein